MGLSANEREKELSVVDKFIDSRSLDEVYENLALFSDKTNNYVETNWMPYVNEFIDNLKPEKLHLGVRTTNRAEGYFSKLKPFTGKKNKLVPLLSSVNDHIIRNRHKVEKDIKDNYFKMDNRTIIEPLKPLFNSVTNYAYEYMQLTYTASLDLAQVSFENENECSYCSSYLYIGLPFIHMFRYSTEINWISKFINNRWKLCNFLTCYEIEDFA